MRPLASIIQLAVAVFLCSCDQQHPAANIDPKLGLDCFESQRASLPPGTQYEGIDKLSESRLTIKIMNGMDVVTLDCGLTPEGILQATGK
jgi:hypothetical protein